MNSFIKWVGGKSQLRDKIISIIPAHKTYIEPFAGAGWVLFGKPPSPSEFINDIDNELINLYLTVKTKPDEFQKEFKKFPISQKVFESLAAGDGLPEVKRDMAFQRFRSDRSGDGIPNVDMAVFTYYLVMGSFNSFLTKPSFAISNSRESPLVKFHSTDWQQIKDRLKRVTLLSLDFEDVIKKLDGPESVFYLDPPYTVATGNEYYYRHTFEDHDHERLEKIVNKIKGKFIMSYNNVAVITNRYTDFNIIEYSKDELLITNFEPADEPFYCSTGIPETTTTPRRTAWFNGNCPYCQSRNVQQLYRRVTFTKDGKSKRNFVKDGYKCNGCLEVFK